MRSLQTEKSAFAKASAGRKEQRYDLLRLSELSDADGQS